MVKMVDMEMAVNDASIRKIPGEQGQQADTSLRGHSLQRALGRQVPKTLTPHEWQQWYAEYGVPDSHKGGSNKTRRSWWKFWIK